MADIFCPHCGEPWDMDCLHDEVSFRFNPEGEKQLGYVDGKYSQAEYDKMYQPIRKEFQKNGCIALTSYSAGHNEDTIDRPRNSVYGALMELAGDDIDFAVSMMEDAERYGLLD